MHVNEYDNETFFAQYAQMSRSRDGLAGAGEWHHLMPLFPDLKGKRVLDLGCGYGWHCEFAQQQGAVEVLGLDLSEKMLAQARQRNSGDAITYRRCAIEDYEYPENRWDCVVSNLALHYIRDLSGVFQLVYRTLTAGGVFLMNIEHPVFTAGVGQDWIYDDAGAPKYWPVDNYFLPGQRETNFLGCPVLKEHHTLTQVLMGLIHCGFTITAVEEAQPPAHMMDLPGMADELRRPMMLLVKTTKSSGG